MRNKLLLSTAIASVAFAGFASAETKVGGNLEQTFNATSEQTAQNSKRALGAEYNITLSSSKDLDNGLTAKYGFIMEDGTSDTHYLTVGGDVVSLTVGRDTGNNLSSTAVPHLGDQAGTLVGLLAAQTYDNVEVANTHEGDHVSIDANVAGGTLTARYAPDYNYASINRGTDTSAAETGQSSTEILYSGSPVENLKLIIGQSTIDGEGAAEDGKFRKAGAAYSFGQFTAGVEKQDSESADATASQVETDTISYGVTFAASDTISLGINYLETEKKSGGTKATADEEVTTISLGYNLGGLGIVATYSDVENVANTSGDDAEVLQIRTVQKF